jgi:hypothetical protein
VRTAPARVPASIAHSNLTRLWTGSKTRAFVDFVVEAFRREGLPANINFFDTTNKEFVT